MATPVDPSVIANVVIASGLWPGAALADEVRLSDGTVLAGTVKSVENGVLSLSTSYSDAIEIKTSGITAVSTNGSIELVLFSGEVLIGTLAVETDGSMVLAAEGGERTPVTMSTVGELNSAGKRWSGDVAFGSTLVEGNAETLGFTVNVSATRTAQVNRVISTGWFTVAETDDQLTTRNMLTTIEYDHYVARRSYVFVSEELFHDRFKDMNLRTVTAVGVGRILVRRPSRRIEAEIGVSYLTENFAQEVDDRRMALRGGVSVEWPLTSAVSFTNHFVLHPRLQGEYEFQIVNQGSFDVTLTSSWGLTFSFVVHHDSEPPGTTEGSDVHWLLGLDYSF